VFKNTASQQWIVFAFQDEGGANPGEPIAGDAAQITANVRIDAGAANAVDDLNPTELEDGYYSFGITAAESNGDSIVITPVSSTANVNVIGVPGAVYTRTDVSGVEAKIDIIDTNVDDIETAVGVAGAGLTDITLNAASIDLVWDEVVSGGAHTVADSTGRRLKDLQEFGTYEKGAIWIDTVNGSAGTTDFESGTVFNPVNTIADANTLAVSLGLTRFEYAPGSSITFVASQIDELHEGRDWTLALGGQDITGAFIFGANVTGICTATGKFEFEECDLGAVTMDNDGHFETCGLEGTFTVGQAGTFTLHNCFSEAAAGITLDFGALGATTVNLYNFDGDIIPTNMAAGDVLHITGAGSIVTATCTGGIIDHNGFFEYTDAGGNVTEQQSDIKVNVDNIQTRLPAALISGRMDSDVEAINNSTVAAIQLALSANQIEDGAFEGTPSTTTLQTDLAESQDDIYIGRTIIITAGNARGEATDITDYTGSSGTLEVTALANAPAATDTFILI